MNLLANKLADRLVRRGLDPENKEIYAYAIECLLNTTASFGTILIVSIILGKFILALIWMAFFFPIRQTSGGLHASNHIGCYILSISIGIGCLLINPLFVSISWVVWPGLAISIVVIFLFAPVIHKNHPLSRERMLRMKRSARRIVIVESCLCAVLFFIVPAQYPIAAVLGLLSATVSTLIGHVKDLTIQIE